MLSSQNLMAQKGQYISPYGIYQYTSISNGEDYLSRDKILSLENTYHFAYGLQYINNYSNIFGIETGLKYSTTGQKYKGNITYDINTKDTGDIDFSSEVIMQFFHIPFLFRFNSQLDEDRIFMTISAGFQADILYKTDFTTDPAPVIPAGGNINYNALFTSFNFSFVSNATFTYNLSDNLHVFLGFQMARSLGDIEKKKFEYDKTIHPAEYYFPVSTKKTKFPVINPETGFARSSTKLTNYGLLIGLSFLIKS